MVCSLTGASLLTYSNTLLSGQHLYPRGIGAHPTAPPGGDEGTRSHTPLPGSLDNQEDPRQDLSCVAGQRHRSKSRWVSLGPRRPRGSASSDGYPPGHSGPGIGQSWQRAGGREWGLPYFGLTALRFSGDPDSPASAPGSTAAAPVVGTEVHASDRAAHGEPHRHLPAPG